MEREAGRKEVIERALKELYAARLMAEFGVTYRSLGDPKAAISPKAHSRKSNR